MRWETASKTIAGFLLLALIVPWFITPSPSISESYAFGFSNKAFIIIFALELGFIYLSARKADSPRKIQREETSALLTPILFGLGVMLLSLFAVFFFFSSGIKYQYAEAEYFLQRAKLMEIGLVPYKDFSYAYGLLLIYSFKVIASLLGIALEKALVTALFIESIVGYVSLYYVISRVIPSRNNCKWIFLVFFAATSLGCMTAGLQYTFLRYATPLALAIGVYDFVIKYPKRMLFSSPLGVAFVFLCGWLVSPEIGITASLALSSALVLTQRSKVLPILVCLTYLLLFFVPPVRQSMQGLFEFAGGGDNFPVFPSLLIIFFMLCAYLSAFYVKNAPPIDFIVFLFSFFNLPGAFGRCDFGHVVYYSFGFLILALKVVFEHDWSPKKTTFILAGCFFLFANTLSFWMGAPLIGKLIFSGNEKVSPILLDSLERFVPGGYRQEFEKFKYRLHAPYFEIASHYPGALIFKPSYILLTSIQASRFKYSYFSSLDFALSIKANARIARDIDSANFIVASTGSFDRLCAPRQPDPKSLSLLLFFPVGLFHQKNDPATVRSVLCQSVKDLEVVQSDPLGLSVFKHKERTSI